MSDYPRPLPEVTDLNRPHWEGAKEHRYLIQKCKQCGHLWFPPVPNCNRCLSYEVEWVDVSGKGTVHSFIVYQQAWHPGFKDDIPYNLAIIELEEGVRLMNNVVVASNDQIEVGMAVEVVYDDVTDEVTIPRFKPA